MSGGFPAILALSLCVGQTSNEDPFERREVARLTELLEKPNRKNAGSEAHSDAPSCRAAFLSASSTRSTSPW